MDVLRETAGYVDSSDYESQSYDLYSPKLSSYKSNKQPLRSNKYKIGSYNDSKYDFSTSKAGVYRKGPKTSGYTNEVSNSNFWSPSDFGNLYINRVEDSKLNENLYGDAKVNSNDESSTSGWEERFYRNKASAKSPRFGRDDLSLKVDDTSKGSLSNRNNNDTNKLGRENRDMFNSTETVDSLTPMNEATKETGSEFKWWCKTDGLNVSSVESPNVYHWDSSVNAGESPGNSSNFDENNNKSNEKSQNSANESGLSDRNDPVTLETDYQADGSVTSDFTESLSEDNENNVDNSTNENVNWKSWTVGGNELEELRTRLVQKLLNKKLTPSNELGDYFNDLASGTSGVELSGNKSEGGWDELGYYREMNKVLFEKLKLLLNGSSKLEYNLSYEYITSVQNHLLKVHQYINSKTGLVSSEKGVVSVNNDKVSSTTSTNEPDDKVEDGKTEPSPVRLEQVTDVGSPTVTKLKATTENNEDNDTATENHLDKNLMDEYERLKNENEELKKEVSSLKLAQTTNSGIDNSLSKSPTARLVEKCNSNDVEDPEKAELLEKLKVVQQSRDNLEEDFKKTLTYMRLMKDRLKMFKKNNTVQKPSAGTPVSGFNSVNSPSVAGVPKAYPGGYGNIGNTYLKSVPAPQGVLNGYVRRANTATSTAPINTTSPMGSYNRLNQFNVSENNINNTDKWNTKPIVRSNTSYKRTTSPENGREGLPERSNSCVRFNETSEMYFVPRSLSENKTILVNNTGSRLNRFFKIFSKT